MKNFIRSIQLHLFDNGSLSCVCRCRHCRLRSSNSAKLPRSAPFPALSLSFALSLSLFLSLSLYLSLFLSLAVFLPLYLSHSLHLSLCILINTFPRCLSEPTGPSSSLAHALSLFLSCVAKPLHTADVLLNPSLFLDMTNQFNLPSNEHKSFM